MRVEVRNHLLFIDGSQIAYQATPNRGGVFRPEGIVLHDTAGDLRGTGSVSWLRNPSAVASAHMVIGRGQGAVLTQLAPFNVVTWHAGVSSYNGRSGCNAFTIGLEISNPGKLAPHDGGRYRNGTPQKPGVIVSPSDGLIERRSTKEHGDGYWMGYTAEQIALVKDICWALKAFYSSISFITTHWAISPGRKVDTNPLFPLEEVRGHILGRQPSPAPSPVPAAATGRIGTTTADSLNFRRAPNGTITGSLPKGTRIEINSRDGDWLHVTTPAGYSGFVHANFVKID